MATSPPLIPDRRLLDALAEQLKEPLVHIAREAELGAETKDLSVLETLQYTATSGLKLIDSFLLSTELQDQQVFELEPVSISAILYDVAEELQPLAREQGNELVVALGGRYGPIMAHARSLRAAFRLLGYSLLGGESGTIRLGAHHSKGGIVAGVFSDQPGLTTDAYRRGRALLGTARAAVPDVSDMTGAGVFMADALFAASNVSLKAAEHDKRRGLAVTLLPSQQLQLI